MTIHWMAALCLHSALAFQTSFQQHQQHYFLSSQSSPAVQSAKRIKSHLPAVLVEDELVARTRKRAWPKRIIRKVFGPPRETTTSTSSSTRLQQHATAPPLASAVRTENNTTFSDAFIIREYASLTPSEVLPLEIIVQQPHDEDAQLMHPLSMEHESYTAMASPSSSLPSSSAFPDQTTTSPIHVETPPAQPNEHPQQRSPLLARVTGKKAETILTTLFDRWTDGAHTGLHVRCDPNGGVVDLVRGQFRADAAVEFDQMSFGALHMSQGKIESHRLALNLYKFAPFFCKRIPRFASAFELEAHNVVFTQQDLFESPCIRHGLKRLLTRILHNRGMKASQVEITSIKILSTGKVGIGGYATVLNSKVDFEVRTGLGVASRGHVLTFPGLEISLGPAAAKLFVPVVPELSLDMGNNAILTHVRLHEGTLELSCRTTITPRHTRKLANYEQSTHAYAASFHFDVGRWLTRIGNFSE